MVTWEDVTRWDSAPLRDAVAAINNAYNKVVACSDDLRDINTPYGWHGEAASAAAAEVNQIIDGLEEYAAEVASLRRSSGDVSDAITGVHNAVTEAEGLARTHHFTIGGDGSVIDNGPPPDTPEDQKEAVAAERRTIAAELADRVEQVLRQAVDIDDDFCAVLDRILAGHTIDATGNDNENTSLAAAGNSGGAMGSLSILAPPPVDASPSANAAWWAALSQNQRLRLIKDHPEMVGNRDGVAAWARSSANIALLEHERQELRDERTQLMKTAPEDLSFDQGINASRPEDPHLTALGHSYGSLTTGIALNSHTGVDDAVFFGSPGISDTPAGQQLGEAEIRRMQLPEGHAYNLEADGDVVADIGSLSHGRYGTDPSEMAGMNQLETGAAVTPDGRPLAGSTGHSEYTKTMPDGTTDSTSKYNIAAVVSGHAELAIPARG